MEEAPAEAAATPRPFSSLSRLYSRSLSMTSFASSLTVLVTFDAALVATLAKLFKLFRNMMVGTFGRLLVLV